MNNPVALYLYGELLETALLPTSVDSPRFLGVRKASDSIVSHVYPDASIFSGVSFGKARLSAAPVDLGRISTSSSQGLACYPLLSSHLNTLPPSRLNSCAYASSYFWFGRVVDLSPCLFRLFVHVVGRQRFPNIRFASGIVVKRLPIMAFTDSRGLDL